MSFVCLLAASVLATIYLAWLFYPLEISWLGLEKIVYMTPSHIRYNFNHLMSYLTNPFVRRLAMPDFPSSAAGLKHFADVKRLFHLTQLLFLLTFVPTIYFVKKEWQQRSLWQFHSFFRLIVLLPFLLGFVAGLLGFETFFTLFHQVLFAGDSTWLFNPNTDSVIYILPEAFFQHCFLLFFASYELLFGAILLEIRREKQSYLRRKFTND